MTGIPIPKLGTDYKLFMSNIEPSLIDALSKLIAQEKQKSIQLK